MTLNAAFALKPAESKRLIARAVAAMPEVRAALERDLMVVAHGSTNVFIAEEVLGGLNRDRGSYLSGLVINGVFCLTEASEKGPLIVIERGKVVPPKPSMTEILDDAGPDAVFVKGANAVDPDGNAGVFLAHSAGGTIGFALGTIAARGIRLIVPVGLEKLIPSVRDACRVLGHNRLYYQTGVKIGMMPLMNATVVTEIDAFRILFGLDAVHAGGGGVSDSEGTIVLVATGEKSAIDRAIAVVEAIKGEPDFVSQKAACATCVPSTPSVADREKQKSTGRIAGSCPYQGKAEEDLPTHFIRRRTRQPA